MLYYSGLSRTLRQLRWVLYPRRCPFCDRVLGNQPACPDCANGLAELRRAPSMRLRGSEHYLVRLDGAAAPYRYTGLVRRAVLRAKYQGAPWAAVELGVEMARLLFGSKIRMRGSEPLPEPVPGLDRGYDCILPVPASSKKRGYNVPERMAQPLARAVGVPVVTDALIRARSTRRQEGLSLDERLANVAGGCGGKAHPSGGRCPDHRSHGLGLRAGSAGCRCAERVRCGAGYGGVSAAGGQHNGHCRK